MQDISDDHDHPSSADGLVFGCVLDGRGLSTPTDWPSEEQWQNDAIPIWLHLEADHPETQHWLRSVARLPDITIEALLARETRPRISAQDDQFWVILRGVNFNAGAEPDDMVSMRIWCDGKRVITMRIRRLKTVRDLRATLTPKEGETGKGPRTIASLFYQLIAQLVARKAQTVDAIEDELSEAELELEGGNARQVRGKISALRLRAVNLRRYLAPQREALIALAANPPAWLDEMERRQLHETADRLTRYVEEIDAARERAIVLKDDATNQIAEKSERTLYVLSIISAIFLPLSFLTGLLGMNVGGLPGIDYADAFLWVCFGMGLLLIVQLAAMRWLRWL